MFFGVFVAGLTLGALGTSATDAAAQVRLGSASNLTDGLRHEARPVTVHAASDTVVFVHPQDVTIWGGGGSASGRFRYDVSTDGGRTFRTDIGPLQAEYRFGGRHPSGLLVPGRDALRLTWLGGTQQRPLPEWLDHVSGTFVVSADAAPISTEHYLFGNDEVPADVPVSLSAGAVGVMWSVGVEDPAVRGLGTLTLYRGDFDNERGDVLWSVSRRLTPAYRPGTPTPGLWSPRVAFEPEGRRGWVSFLADLDDVPDRTGGRRPVFWQTSDGGRSFGNPRSIDLRQVPLVSRGGTEDDVVARLREAGALSPEPTVTAQSDLTVDGNGNPHLLLGLSAVQPFGELQADTVTFHLLVDLTSPDGGRTWRMLEIAPLRTHLGTVGFPEPATYGNEPQIARDATGEHVFFAWIDSNGQNLGERLRDNEAPDLNVSALRVRDEARTAPRNLTDLDLLWNGVIHFPRMAPEVLLRDRQWHLPIVTVELLSNDPTQPVQFHYFGERATFPLDVFGGVIDPPDPDAGVVDAEVVDAQVVDAQVVDAQVIDGDLADAEVVTDAAPADAAPADAAPADGGPEADGGVAVDGGVADGAAADGATADRGAADAAPGIDQAGVGALDAALNDGAVDGALGSDGGGDGGCGCRVEAHNPPTSFGILALSLLGLVRRRRR